MRSVEIRLAPCRPARRVSDVSERSIERVHRFRAKEVRLALSVIAYNLGNLWLRLGLPKRIDTWSLTSLQQRLMKTGGRLIKHAQYYRLLLVS
jgi:hypothetical protein